MAGWQWLSFRKEPHVRLQGITPNLELQYLDNLGRRWYLLGTLIMLFSDDIFNLFTYEWVDLCLFYL